MNWKEILKEDLTEKVIQALIHFYGSREEVISSNTLGTMYEENLKDLPPMNKDDVKKSRSERAEKKLNEKEKVEAPIEEVVEAKVELTFDPPWTRDLMSEEAKLELGFL